MRHRTTLSGVTALLAALVLAAPLEAKLSKGDPAPPFALQAIDGKSVSSAAVGGLTVLTFLSLDSKPSRELAIHLGDLVRDHAKEGINVIGIAGDPVDKLKEFAAQQKLGFPLCSDSSRETLQRYGAENVVPLTYLLTPEGAIAEVVSGGGAGAQQALLAIAAKEFARGNSQAAASLYGAVAKSDPQNVEARAGLGFALAKTGKLERAEEEFKVISAAGPAAGTAAADGLAEVRLRRGDLDGALRSAPADSAYGHIVRGEVAARRGQLDEAARVYRSGAGGRAALPWQNGVALNNLANISRTRGDASAAVKTYDRAIAAEPFLVEARSNKGAALEKAGRPEEAKKALAAARSIAPSDQLVATLLRRIETEERAKGDLERQKLANQLVGELVAAYRSGKPPVPAADDWSPRALVVSLLDFREAAGPLDREGIAEAFVLALTSHLQESGRVKVVEREIIDKLLAELKLGSSELADPATRLKLGRVLAASVIGTGGFRPASVGTDLQLRLIDTETTDIRTTLSERLTNPGEVATFAAKIGDRLVKELRASYPLKGKIASVDGSEIVVGVGRKHGAAPGLRFNVVADGEPIEIDGEVLGRKQKQVGRLELTRIEDGFAYAKPLDGSGFEKGQHLVEVGP